MADKANKYPENKPGKYYVDRECIACDACVMTAPKFFSMDQDDGHAFVVDQPKDSDDEDLCREAMEGCPVEAIGNDGEPQGQTGKSGQ
jgi:ferredoxin